MFPINHMPSVTEAKDTMLNGQGLEHVKALGRAEDPRALKAVAKQFESIFIQQMLKGMRAANAAFSEDSYFNSNEMQFHQDMMDQQMSLELSSGRGLGLAEALYQQMVQAYGDRSPESSEAVQVQPLAQPFTSTALGVTQRTSALENSLSTKNADEFSSPEDFIRELTPYAEKAAALLKVQPGWLLAQAALETGWGKFVNRTPDGESSFNLFNIKADHRWQGETLQVQTTEYEQGIAKQVSAEFRRYRSYADSFSDYVDFLQRNPRYAGALASTDSADSFVSALQSAGYATDPQYAEKIQRIISSERLQEAGALEASAIETPQPTSVDVGKG